MLQYKRIMSQYTLPYPVENDKDTQHFIFVLVYYQILV